MTRERLTRRQSRGDTIRRLGWGVGDQVLSSLTNFGLSVFVARSVDPRGLGAFTALFATYVFALGATRALVLEPHLVGGGTADHSAERSRVAVLTAALLAGVGAGAVMAVVSFGFSSPLDQGLRALAIVTPGLLLQDAVRYVFFAAGTPRRAALNDGVWAVAMVAALLVVLNRGEPAVSGLVLAWGIAASIAALFGLAQTRTVPQRRALREITGVRRLGMPLFASFVVMSGWNQVLLYGIAAVAGLSVLGTVRAASIAMGPVNIVAIGISTVALREAARIRDRSTRQLRTLILLLGVGLAAVAIAWGVVLLGLPQQIGELLLGENWDGARAVLVPALLLRAVSELNQAQKTGLKVVHAGRRLLTLQLWMLPVTVAATLLGARSYGAYGAIAAKMAALVALTPLWIAALRSATRQHSPGATGRGGSVDDSQNHSDGVAGENPQGVAGPPSQRLGDDG